jgi:hypothetical protein
MGQKHTGAQTFVASTQIGVAQVRNAGPVINAHINTGVPHNNA